MSKNHLTHSAYLKIDRAAEHVNEINKILRENPPFSYVVQTYIQSRQCTSMVKRNKPSIERIACVSGDAIHNLRAALDHVYWSIVSPHVTDVKARKNIQFPYSETLARLNDAVSNRMAQKVSADFFDVFINLKPYSEKGGNKLLALIHTLDVEDKHRLLIPTGDYKQITSEIMLAHGFTGFPAGLTINAGQNMIDAVWQFRSIDPNNIGTAIHGDSVFEKEINIPVDVVFPVRELDFVGPVIPTLYKLIDVTKETIAEMIKVV